MRRACGDAGREEKEGKGRSEQKALSRSFFVSCGRQNEDDLDKGLQTSGSRGVNGACPRIYACS